MLTATRARECFIYEPDTGRLIWKINTGFKPYVGKEAKSLSTDKSGNRRLYVRVDRKPYIIARVIWLIVHGELPAADIDHIDGNPENNRIANLRLATRTQNMANKRMHKNNRSGFKGVHWCTQTLKWKATVIKNRKKHHAGFFASKEDAARAYFDKATQLYGEFATDRR